MNYIVFEGIDGCGKTTQVTLLCSTLPQLYITPIQLAEPTYGKFGAEAREFMRRGDPVSIARQRELFTLDRLDHVRHKIAPLLRFVREHGSFMVVQDRSYLSAPAYQAEGPTAMRTVLCEQQAIAPKPDIVFLLDTPVELAMKRLKARGGQSTLFEKMEFLEKVRERYLFLADEGSEQFKVLDGKLPPKQISETVLGALDIEYRDK